MKTLASSLSRIGTLFMLSGLLLGLAGCGGAPDQFFRLAAEGPVPVGSSGIAVGVGPVTLPGYVDRAELVFMSGSNEVQVPSKVHWAGPLNDNFTRALATDLGRSLGSSNVVPLPWGANVKLRYQVSVDVRQFHAISGGGAVLDAEWRIETAETHQVIHRQNNSFREQTVGDGYEPVVAAESRLVEQLAQTIARSVSGRR